MAVHVAVAQLHLHRQRHRHMHRQRHRNQNLLHHYCSHRRIHRPVLEYSAAADVVVVLEAAVAELTVAVAVAVAAVEAGVAGEVVAVAVVAAAGGKSVVDVGGTACLRRQTPKGVRTS